MVDRGTKEMFTAAIVAVYALSSIVSNKVAIFSFRHFEYSLSKAVFSLGAIGVSTAAILSFFLPILVYVINDNNPGEVTTQTWLLALPLGLTFLMVVSPPFASFVAGTMTFAVLAWTTQAAAVGVIAGPNRWP